MNSTSALLSRPASPISAIVLLQREPEEAAGAECQQVWQCPDRREARPPEHLHRHPTLERAQIEFHRLRRASEVVDTEDDVVLVLPDVREDLRVLGGQCVVGAQPEDGVLLAQWNETAQPAA